MPPCISPSGCLRFSRTVKRTCAEVSVRSTHSSPRKPSKVFSSGMTGAGSDARSQGGGPSLTLARGSRPPRPSPRPQHDRLGLRIEVERLLAVLLAVAARLPAAERELVVDLRTRVDPGVARLDAGRGFAGSSQVFRPDGRPESERRRVRVGDRLVEIAYTPDRKSGTEHLLGRHRRIVRGIDDHRGCVEEAVGEVRVVGGSAAGPQLAAGVQGPRYLAGHL